VPPRGAFATEVIVVIAWNHVEGKPDEMPRLCPLCQVLSLIGHGRRRRQAHDAQHTWIWIQRCLCKLCRRTLTLLPDWLIPGGHYSLAARQQAAQLAAGPSRPLEDCVPDSGDGEHCADPSTVRRWLQRRLASLRLQIWLGFPPLPTLFAWDWKAASRTLMLEPNSA
jgi:Domain of unknown function (DUF6431)